MSRSPDSLPSVVNGELLRTSVSQVTTFDLCPRKWWYDKVAKLPRKTGAAQNLGTEIHAQIEHYLTTGEDVLGTIAASGKEFLPAPSPDLLIEAPLANPEMMSHGVLWRGFVDCVVPGAVPEVIDWKTSSSIERYAKIEDQLRSDVQTTTYAEWITRKFPKVDQVRVSLVYFQTKGARRSEKVSTTLDLTVIREVWQKTEQKIAAKKLVARESDPNDVEGNTEACTAYGGCDFAAVCPLSPSRRFSMSLIDRLSGNKEAAPVTEFLAGAAVADETYEVEGKKVKCVGAAGKWILFMREDGTLWKLTKDVVLGSGSSAVQEAPPPVVSTTTAPKPPVEDPSVLPPDASPSLPPPPASIAEDKPKRSRPAKKDTTPAASPMENLVLYVNCTPRSAVQDLSIYVAELAGKLALVAGCSDVRMADGQSPLGFGKWKGALAAAARENPPKGPCTIFSGDLTDPVIEALSAIAIEVVRGR